MVLLRKVLWTAKRDWLRTSRDTTFHEFHSLLLLKSETFLYQGMHATYCMSSHMDVVDHNLWSVLRSRKLWNFNWAPFRLRFFQRISFGYGALLVAHHLISIFEPIEDLLLGMIKGVYAKSARILSSMIDPFGNVTNATPTGTSGLTLRLVFKLLPISLYQPIREEYENRPKFIILFVECSDTLFVICYCINACTFSCSHYWTLIGLFVLKIQFV